VANHRYAGLGCCLGAKHARNRHESGTGANDDSRFQAYASFLVEELKPLIDGEYRTLKEPRHTGLMGSSLGGTCSLTIAWERPDLFGLVASLSGAFQVERTDFIRNVLGVYHRSPKPLRVYLDSGTVDFSRGDAGLKHTARVAAELRRIGWSDDLLHFADDSSLTESELEQRGLPREKWAEARTSQHNEFYWRLRVWQALIFLFPPE
jgi:enterochelin esterase-like enzyme